MHFLLRGPFSDFEQKTCRLQLLSFCQYLLLSKFSISFTIYLTEFNFYAYNSVLFLD